MLRRLWVWLIGQSAMPSGPVQWPTREPVRPSLWSDDVDIRAAIKAVREDV